MVDRRLLIRVVRFATPIALCPAYAFAAEPQTPAIASTLIQTVVALVAVCLLAAASLRWAARRLGTDRPDAPMRVLSRLPLEPRRTLLVVRVADRTMLLASSESGIQPLGDLAPEQAAIFEAAAIDRAPIVSRETSVAVTS